jgi:hypothetical protein
MEGDEQVVEVLPAALGAAFDHGQIIGSKDGDLQGTE